MSDPQYTRVYPPEALSRPGLGFARDRELEDFVRNEFLGRGGLFFDMEHGHLGNRHNRVGFLWMSSLHVDKGSVKAGTAQLVKRGEPHKWGEVFRTAALLEMFEGNLPTFLITLSAPICATYDDREFFALIDHELSHCAVAKDEWGAPKFNEQTGEPVWRMRPHDHEGFAGTTERWGAQATGAAGIVAAGTKKPRFQWVRGRDLDVRKACGTP